MACLVSGDDAAWAEDYIALCEEHGADHDVGIDLDMFANLVNDESGNGCASAGHERLWIGSVWEPPATKSQHSPCNFGRVCIRASAFVRRALVCLHLRVGRLCACI